MSTHVTLHRSGLGAPRPPQRVVWMFVYNNCTTDARVIREATSLHRSGYDVRVVAVLDRTTEPLEERDGVRILRIDRNPIHYRILRRVRAAKRGLRLARARARRGLRRAGRIPRRVHWRLKRIARLAAAVVASLVPRVPRADQRAAAPPAPGRSAMRRAIRVLRVPLLPAVLAVRGPAWLLAGLRRMSALASRLAYRSLMRLHKPLMFTDYYWRAYRLVRADGGAGVVHAHDLNTLPVAAALSRSLKVPLVYDSHELYPDVSTLSALESRVWRVIERLLAHRSTQTITVCESIAEELSRRYRVPSPVVLLNCPDSAAFEAPAQNLLRAKLGVSDWDAPLVLYQGGFTPYRGLETLVRATKLLEGRAIVVLMGWGRIEEDLRALIRSEGLTSRVLVTAPVAHSELMTYTAGAEIGVIPYEPVGLNNTYTTPNKLFEYLAVGLPVVGSRLPELTRVLEGHDVGVTFAPGDPEDLARALDRLLADPDRRAAMRANALAVRHRFTWQQQSRKLVQLYTELDGSVAP